MRLLFDVNDVGSRIEKIPKCQYNFVTVFNNSRFDFTLFAGNSVSVENIVGNCPAYTILTFPHEKLVDSINFVWGGGGGVGFERCKIFFTEENLGLVGQFRIPEDSPVNELDRELFSRRLVVGESVNLLATRKTVIKAGYICNRSGINGVFSLTIRSRFGDTRLLSSTTITANSSLSIGFLVLGRGDRLILSTSALNVNFDVSIHGVGDLIIAA